MDRTPFAGLTRLAPGESLSTDEYSFQASNPTITDQLLRLAVLTHRHDGHAKLADPAVDPAVATDAAGGTIPADTSIYVGFTLTDADGGETALNPLPQVITTATGLATPADPPTLAADVVAGTLLAGRYDYAVTVRDNSGGETALGAIASVTIPVGSPTNRIVVSGLAAIVAASGGTGWRLWRRVNGGQWNLVGDAVTATLTDDGSLPLNCNVAPPLSTASTTNGTNRLRVTVPAGQPAAAVQFNIYASVDGSFSSPALLGTYPIADQGIQKTYTQLTLLDGAPPPVSRTFAGLPKIDSSNILGLRFKPPVADNAAAWALAGSQDGDVRVQLDNHHLLIWTGAAWVDITGDPHFRAPANFAGALPTAASGINLKGDVRVTTDDFHIHVWDGFAWQDRSFNTPQDVAATIAAPAAGWDLTNLFYVVDASQNIWLEGFAIKTGAAAPAFPELLFTLLMGYMPAVNARFPVATDDSTNPVLGMVALNTDGTVRLLAGANTVPPANVRVHFDSVRYRVA